MTYRPLYEGKFLYHFCAAKFLPGIKKKGLRLGTIPWGHHHNIKLIPGYQWLTVNPEYTQSWNEGSSLPYDRTELRLTVSLPKVERFNLFKWTEFGKDNPLFDDLNSFGDPESWYVFRGVVIPFWITDIHKKGSAQLT